MTINSKAKGRSFEYIVRDKLTETFDSQFERVPLSGALSYLKGDVYPPWLPDFPWCVEGKHHKEVKWNDLLTAKSSLLISFWEQTKREALVMKKNPLLIYKWDRSKIFACWNDNIVDVKNKITVEVDNNKFYIALLDDWLHIAKAKYKKPY